MNDITTNGGTSVVERAPSPVAEIRMQLEAMEGQFKAALPAHIPVERFMRVVMTALQNNPELIECERRSLWNSAMKAAQDGLLPDGREGAMIVRKDRNRGKIANWQPMIAGIRKKARNSGEIATWDAHVIYENDHFQFQLGDAPQINHTRDLRTDPGKIIGAYSVALMKDGSKSYEVMTIGEIHGIRDRSDAWRAYKAGYIKSTPWLTDEGEMSRKTVARRHSKVLPMSTDLDDLVRRDDDLYGFDEAKEEARLAAEKEGRPKTLSGRLDMLAQLPSSNAASTTNGNDAQAASPGGEAAEESARSADASPAADQASQQPLTPVDAAAGQAASESAQETSQSEAATAAKWPADRVPATEAEYAEYSRSWFADVGETMTVEAAVARWKEDKKHRNRIAVSEDARDALKIELDRIVAAVKKAA